MDRKRLMRLLLAVGGAIGIVVALLALLVAINAGLGFAGCTGTSPLGWTIPLVSGGLIGGVAWMLLLRAPNYSDESEVTARRSVPCPSCGKAVMRDWRLCPYCSDALPKSDSARQRLG